MESSSLITLAHQSIDFVELVATEFDYSRDMLHAEGKRNCTEKLHSKSNRRDLKTTPHWSILENSPKNAAMTITGGFVYLRMHRVK